jgi:hypothetical protein
MNSDDVQRLVGDLQGTFGIPLIGFVFFSIIEKATPGVNPELDARLKWFKVFFPLLGFSFCMSFVVYKDWDTLVALNEAAGAADACACG